jgi:hypothetical protein
MLPNGFPAVARRVLPPLVAMLLAAGGWVLLVVVAIDLGSRGREGDTAAWFLVVLAGLGAALCLVVAIFFARLLLVAVGVISDYQGKRARR